MLLRSLRIPEMNHGKLPDVVLYDRRRNWLFLIEAVTTHGPVSPKRHAELEAMLRRSTAGRIYVTAFSRAKSGERQMAAKHVSALRRLLDSRSPRRHLAPFALSNSVLSLLSPTEATDIFRNLLLAEAARQGLPQTSVSVSSQNSIADGGIDASIIGDVQTSADSLLAGNPRFQIKTGDVHPWRKSWVNRELFDKRTPHGADALGSAVRRCLDDGAPYCLVCFGVDPTDENLRKAHDNFKSAFEMCGYAHAKVSIWGRRSPI